MSEISIQVRRVTEKVKQYYSIFGLRPFARMSPGRSVIKGSKRLGFDEIECVVAETARGTSVGFYAINQFQALFNAIPFLFILLLTGLAQVDALAPTLTGTSDGFLPVNLVKLFTGNSTFSFYFVFTITLFGVIFSLVDYITQSIRLDIIKSRFSFYSRDAIWETREIPQTLIVIKAIRSVFIHLWILAIIYFGAFASTGDIVAGLVEIYGAGEEALVYATIDAFTITGGLVLGLLTSYKAILLRKYYARTDNRLRISGGLMERRIDPILFGIQASMFSAVLFSIFLSMTFLTGATSLQMAQFLVFALIGGGIAGAIQAEGNAWITASYAVFVFFTSLILIFRTGEQPGYAYVVVLQLFYLPIPFLILLSSKYQGVLKKADINNPSWYFDTLPLMSFVSLYLQRRKEIQARRAYEASLDEEISTEVLDQNIKIMKELLQDTQSHAYKMVRHYFELLFTYTASFEESQFVTLPTLDQLKVWWSSKKGTEITDSQVAFFNVADQLLWDPDFQPSDKELAEHEAVGREMVLSIQ